MTLSPLQQKAVDAALLGTEAVTLIEGYAGTGKTFVLAHLAQEAPTAPVLTPTNKAAQVLRQRGIPRAQTLYSYMYRPYEQDIYELDPYGDPILVDGKPVVIDTVTRFGAKGLGAGKDKAPLAFFDEASMMDDKQIDDAMELFERIVVFRDPFQLPPVKRRMAMDGRQADVFLDEVHRAAWDSPITRFATRIRRRESMDYDGLRVVNGRAPIDELAKDGWQSIAWSNHKRRSLIFAYRKALGLGRMPKVGEELICLENIRTKDRGLAYFNGEILPLKKIVEGRVFEFEGKPFAVRTEPFWLPGWKMAGGYATVDEERDRNFDFAYCLTCHKSQGSEWPKVCVFDDTAKMRGDMKPENWLYTAVTRAKSELMIAKGG